MNAWRLLLIALSSLLLGGCLVSFNAPLPASQAAPAGLVGRWVSKDAWGQHLALSIKRNGADHYLAISTPAGQPRDEVGFTVAGHGSRWYASARMPADYGGQYALVGFELTDDGALVVYNLDVDRVRQALQQQALRGEGVDGKEGEGVRVDSDLDQVFAYLDDPANSDVFVEIARYTRAKPIRKS
ncbi:lipoprotein [Pseudomonas sp. M47T1]|uniref:hypothetical protein n=1 Tax=unclassified Pseudomonas TaxID=196821 RepID=UPI000260826C|nr:hypothetical protein [Pseudomonas sp. M47T1]EIK97790.1 lipoprotein [Pseudomonas sp. M47T1]